MGVITDRIRKINNDDQIVPSGPGHAGIWVNGSGELMLNVDGSPEEVGSGGGVGSGDTLDIRSTAPSGDDDAAWVQKNGNSPTMTIALKVRINGTTYVVASITA